MKTIQIKSRRKGYLMLVLIAVLTSLSYLVLHELGHLVVVKSFGAKLTDFSLNVSSAHISFNRNDLSNIQNSIIGLSGVLFPLLISLSILVGSKKSSLLSIASLFLFISSLFSLIPFFIPHKNPDTMNFMKYSGISQIYVSIIFCIIFILGFILLFQKSIKEKRYDFFKIFYLKYSSMETNKYRKQIIGISFLIVSILALSNFSFFNNQSINNFEKVESFKLNNTIKYSFELARINCSGQDTLLIQTKNLIGDYVKIIYKTSDYKNENPVLKGHGVTFKGYRRFKVVPKSGATQILVDGENINGEISVFINK